MIKVHSNAAQVAIDMGLASAPLEAAMTRITRNAGRRLVTAVKNRAPDRGTPDDRSYKGSWKMQFTGLGGTAVATVGTNKPHGYRLEHGFHGADSLGRVFSQSPNPHVEPAVAEVAPVFLGQVSAAVAAWAAGGSWVK